MPATELAETFVAGDTIAISGTLEGSGSIEGGTLEGTIRAEPEPYNNLAVVTVETVSAAARTVVIRVAASESIKLRTNGNADPEEAITHLIYVKLTQAGIVTTFGPIKFDVVSVW